MEDAKQTVTLSKLISREKFYKEKALKLEKALIFSEEQVTAMQARIKDLTQKVETFDQKQSNDVSLRDELKQTKIDLEKKAEEEQQLRAQIQTLEAQPKDVSKFEEKIKAYEMLLLDVEKTLNAKEKEIKTLQKRLEQFEKQAHSLSRANLLTTQEAQKDNRMTHTILSPAISYSDHAVIFSEKSCVVRGDLIIENIGGETLHSPLVCFKLNPIDAISLRGKLVPQDGTILDEGNRDWSIVQNEWSEERKTQGEIWIAPTQPISIEVRRGIRIPDLQFHIDTEFCKKVIIEPYVFFEDRDIQIKVMNPILLNFS